jgi:hypothetical protein
VRAADPPLFRAAVGHPPASWEISPIGTPRSVSSVWAATMSETMRCRSCTEPHNFEFQIRLCLLFRGRRRARPSSSPVKEVARFLRDRVRRGERLSGQAVLAPLVRAPHSHLRNSPVREALWPSSRADGARGVQATTFMRTATDVS